jgi:hypothetical protein
MLNRKAVWYALKTEWCAALAILAVAVLVGYFAVPLASADALRSYHAGMMQKFVGLSFATLALVAFDILIVYAAWFSVRMEYRFSMGLQEQEKARI